MSENKSSKALICLYLVLPFIVLSTIFFLLSMYFHGDDIIDLIGLVLILLLIISFFVLFAIWVLDKSKTKKRENVYFWLLVSLFVIGAADIFGIFMYKVIIENEYLYLLMLIMLISFFITRIFKFEIREKISKWKEKKFKRI